MRAKHTPGPWSHSVGNLVRVFGPNQTTICGVHRLGKNLGRERGGEIEANARLIAAAPELLEALHQAEIMLRRAQIETRDMGTAEACEHTREIANAALAKAEGAA